MKHRMLTKALAVFLAVAILIPGGTLLVSAECDHDFSVKEVVSEATCTTDRVLHYRCSKCDEVEKDSGGNPIDYHSGKTIHDMIADGSASKSQYYAETTEATCEDAKSEGQHASHKVITQTL